MGRVTSQTDGNKHTTTYVRDYLGNITQVKDPLGRLTFNEYNRVGDLTKTADAEEHVTTYTYDPASRLTEVTYSDEKTPAVKYEYDADGNRIEMADGTGTTTYTYDTLDRPVHNTDGHGNKTGWEYDLAGQQTKLTYPNGTQVTRTYDNTGRLQSVTDPFQRLRRRKRAQNQRHQQLRIQPDRRARHQHRQKRPGELQLTRARRFRHR